MTRIFTIAVAALVATGATATATPTTRYESGRDLVERGETYSSQVRKGTEVPARTGFFPSTRTHSTRDAATPAHGSWTSGIYTYQPGDR